MTFKSTLRFPTDTYAYIEVEYEGEPDDIVSTYRAFKRLLEPTAGLPTKDWNAALDGYLKTNTMKSEIYEAMSAEQKQIIQEIKKSFKRMEPLPFK